MVFILLSLAFLLSVFTGWLLSKDYKIDENCSTSIRDGKTNKIAAKAFLIIGGFLLLVGIITLII